MQNIRMLFCQTYVAAFTHENIRLMGTYFHINFVTTSKHVVVVKAIKSEKVLDHMSNP